MNLNDATWINPPNQFSIDEAELTLQTNPQSDLWQRTFYGMRRDNGHMLCWTTERQYFSFEVRVDYAYASAYDQAGIVVYQSSDNWAKACVENTDGKHPTLLGSVVTRDGYSDWSTQEADDVSSGIHYRLSRRVEDFKVEWSRDSLSWQQLRIFHLSEADARVRFGLMACSPSQEGSFEARYSHLRLGECVWAAE